MIKLLVFDLDGTLIDSRLDLANAVNAALDQNGFETLATDLILTFIGDGAKNLIARSLNASHMLPSKSQQKPHEKAYEKVQSNLKSKPDSDLIPISKSHYSLETDIKKVLLSFLSYYPHHCLENTLPYPGIVDVLNNLSRANYSMAILTNKPLAPAEKIIRGLNLRGHFIQIVGGDNPWGIKPNPDALKQILGEAKVLPEEAIMIGDGLQDFEVAKAAGMHFIGFLQGIGERDKLLAQNPDFTLEEMRTLPEVIAAIEMKNFLSLPKP